MWESIYKCPIKLRDIRKCWLEDSIRGHLNSLTSQGYTSKTVRRNASLLLSYAAFLEKRNLAEIPNIVKGIEPFCKNVSKRTGQSYCSMIMNYVKYLIQRGVIPPIKEPMHPFSSIISDYLKYLHQTRGLSKRTIYTTQANLKSFCDFIHNNGIRSLKSLNNVTVQKFVEYRSKKIKRQTSIKYCRELRAFLQYLYSNDIINTNLAP